MTTCVICNTNHRDVQDHPYTPRTKQYPGDGVYVDSSEFGDLILTTEDGISITNTIFWSTKWSRRC